jgi:hypothetical protein
MLTPRQEKLIKRINKLSSKQKKFLNDSIELAPTKNLVNIAAPEGMVRHKDTYINDSKKLKTKSPRKQNYPPKKITDPQERVEWVIIKNNQKRAKDNNKPIKPEDQNFGTHDMKGNFIKKKYYGRRTKNPRTPGRGMNVRATSLVRSEYDDEA